jgi:adenosine deaminase
MPEIDPTAVIDPVPSGVVATSPGASTGPAVDDADFIRRMPKVELHCHLEGSVPAATFIELAGRHGVVLPTEDPEHVYDFGSFLEFLDLYYLVCASMRDAADFERAVYDSLAHGVHTSNLRYREMFFSPTNHEGVPYAEMLRGIEAGIVAAEADLGVRCRMIADINRRQSPAVAVELVDTVVAHPSRYVVGIGIDDDEDSGPAAWFVEAFDRAGAAGLKRTAHAGELGNPRHILDSIDLLGCDRIDHGYAMVDEPEVLHRVRESGVHITGAWYVNLFQSGILFDDRDPATSPLAAMVRAGLPVSINSDDPTMIPTDLSAEYAGVAEALGLDREQVIALAFNAVDGAWLDDVERARLRLDMEEGIAALG